MGAVSKLENLTLRHIRLFLAAARFENFSTAARYMYMTQPMVSRIIAGMERDLGVQLFYRNQKKVRLTPAGLELQRTWETLIEQAEAGLQRALETQNEKRRHLGIGNDQNADRDLYFYPILSTYLERYHDLYIDIEHGDTAANIDKLRKGELDFVYAMLYDAPGLDESALTWKVLKESPLFAYASAGSHLYENGGPVLQTLEKETLLLLSEKAESGYTAAVTAFLHRKGLDQENCLYLASMQSINYNLYQGRGVFIGNAFIKLLHREEFKAFPLEGSRDGLIAVWRKEDTRPEVLELVRIASAFFET